MIRTSLLRVSVATALAGAAIQAAPPHGPAPFDFDTARVTIVGSSTAGKYTISTTDVRIERIEVASSGVVWDDLFRPGVLEAFEVVIPAMTLTSGGEVFDRNLHAALKAQAYPDIVFRLTRLERGMGGQLYGVGRLRVAGADREVVLTLAAERRDAKLAVRGRVTLQMTDFGIAPPVVLAGAIETDPKVTISFDAVLAVPLT